MIIKTEATIDIDAKRKIWISAEADVDPAEVDVAAQATVMQTAVTDQALAAYERVTPRRGVVPRDGAAATERALLGGEGKELDPTRTFED